MTDNEIKNDAKLSKFALDIIQDKDIRITELWEERCRIYESLKEAKAEIERLNSYYEKLHIKYENIENELKYQQRIYKTAKSEAIKEFQSKSKEMLIELYKKYYRKANRTTKTDMFYQGRAEAMWECICRNDNLVKETIGDERCV